MNVYHESEHQELVYRDVRFDEPLAVHVPSALGPLKYFVCVRVPTESVGCLEGAVVTAKLSGHRNTDCFVRYGEGVDFPQVVASKAEGMAWVFVSRIPMARGDGTVTFSGVSKTLDGTLAEADVLFCTWARFVTSGQADDLLELSEDPNWAPSGVPLGGIGCGRVDFCRDGKFRNFSGNNNQEVPFEEPGGIEGAYLEIESGGATRRIGAGAYIAAFPLAKLDVGEILPDIDVSVVLTGTMTPHDVRLSSLPAAMVAWFVKNDSDKPVEVTCRFGWPNLVGRGGGLGEPEKRTGYGDGSYRYWEAPGQPTSQCLRLAVDGALPVAVLKYSNAPSEVCAAADGHHYVAVEDGTAEAASVAKTLCIAPNDAAIVRMALVWEMPHWIDSLGVDRGHYWQNHFKDGEAMLQAIFGEYDEIFEKTTALGTLLAKQTDLPVWLQHRLLNSCYPLVTNSVFYKDGRFSINEGPTEMSGVYGTMDQRLGAHAATQLLFPQLNRKELEEFTAILAEDGGVNHDLGSGHLERPSAPQGWPDLNCSLAIQWARHAWTSADEDVEAALWPKVRLALERHGAWADAGGGIAQLGTATGLGTSYDCYHYEGSTGYMATLWIAALNVGIKWARRVGDAAFVPKAERWIAAAEKRLDEDLWNGAFYRAFGGKNVPANENSHAGMLAGEYYSRLLTGKDVLPRERLEACCKAMMRLQGSQKFAVPPDEATPDGGAGSMYGWLPYIECFCITALFTMKTQGTFDVWKRMIDVMGDLAHPCDTRLMYRPLTGELSWGAYYMTAPAAWLAYDAWTGFRYDARTGELHLDPQCDGTFAVVHPLFWGIVEQRANAAPKLTVTHRFTDKPLNGIDNIKN
ncbi:MAG: GH116 family glycosyl-hydrolase [Kiritimatiellaeota bacterium]|nr:GH116 family glycosyl-hydrolase [Kiritimatiellota bacterium]